MILQMIWTLNEHCKPKKKNQPQTMLMDVCVVEIPKQKNKNNECKWCTNEHSKKTDKIKQQLRKIHTRIIEKKPKRKSHTTMHEQGKKK